MLTRRAPAWLYLRAFQRQMYPCEAKQSMQLVKKSLNLLHCAYPLAKLVRSLPLDSAPLLHSTGGHGSRACLPGRCTPLMMTHMAPEPCMMSAGSSGACPSFGCCEALVSPGASVARTCAPAMGMREVHSKAPAAEPYEWGSASRPYAGGAHAVLPKPAVRGVPMLRLQPKLAWHADKQPCRANAQAPNPGAAHEELRTSRAYSKMRHPLPVGLGGPCQRLQCAALSHKQLIRGHVTKIVCGTQSSTTRLSPHDASQAHAHARQLSKGPL